MRIIAGEARGRRLHAPRGRGTRPALEKLRGSVFQILGESVADGEVLDLFAGSGAFGLEALSRGARRATFVERSPIALASLERNLEELGFASRARVLRGDALGPPPPGERFAVIFLDPPFPLLAEPAAAAAIRARAESLAAEALEPEGSLVLRLPAEAKFDLSRPPRDRREYGGSVVLFLGGPLLIDPGLGNPGA